MCRALPPERPNSRTLLGLSEGGLKRPDGGVERGTVLAGRYQVVDEIGRGGMGIVYRVEHVHTGEPLALKLLVGAARSDPQAIKRFKREARTSARIRSDHVVHVSDADTSPELEGSPFFVMELLHGMDVGKYVAQHGVLQPAELVALLAQVCSVLQTAHGLGIVHRDLKPENLFLHQRKDGTTTAKVLDFGISKFASEDHALETGMTATGLVLGTPLYMAPEQAHGQNDKIAPTTDVWAIGLIAMRLLTGEHYWGAPTMADLMMKIAVLPIVPPSERWPESKQMSPALDAWFLRSCDRDQAKRWPTVMLQLEELAAALGVAVPSPISGALTLSRSVDDSPRALTSEGSTLSPVATPVAGRARQVAIGLGASVAFVAVVVLGRSSLHATAPSAEPPRPAPTLAVASASTSAAVASAAVASAAVSAVSSAPARTASPAPAVPPSARAPTTEWKPRLAPPSSSSSAPPPPPASPLYAPLAP